MALTPAEKQRAYRERQKAQQGNEPVTEAVTEEPAVTEPAVTRPTTAEGLKAAARAGTIELTEAEEQYLRDEAGYTASERRTLAERDGAARRMIKTTVEASGKSTITRYDEHGREVEEEVGPAGLSLIAFPVQRRGDLAP